MSWAAPFRPSLGCSALGDEPRASARGRLLRSRHLSCDPGLKPGVRSTGVGSGIRVIPGFSVIHGPCQFHLLYS